MNILLLGPTPEKLLPCIDTRNDVVFTHNEKIDARFVLEKHIEVLVSYNYRFIIRSNVLNTSGLLAINLHTSLLPFNRGAHPILWSVLEGTPLGVTIHQIDEGLDTGPIIVQKQLSSPEPESSLRQIHESANQELVELFYTNWSNIVTKNYSAHKQQGLGTFHRSAQAKGFLAILENSWDTTIGEARQKYVEYLKTDGIST